MKQSSCGGYGRHICLVPFTGFVYSAAAVGKDSRFFDAVAKVRPIMRSEQYIQFIPTVACSW
jgi:hypothetical protein